MLFLGISNRELLWISLSMHMVNVRCHVTSRHDNGINIDEQEEDYYIRIVWDGFAWHTHSLGITESIVEREQRSEEESNENEIEICVEILVMPTKNRYR